MTFSHRRDAFGVSALLLASGQRLGGAASLLSGTCGKTVCIRGWIWVSGIVNGMGNFWCCLHMRAQDRTYTGNAAGCQGKPCSQVAKHWLRCLRPVWSVRADLPGPNELLPGAVINQEFYLYPLLLSFFHILVYVTAVIFGHLLLTFFRSIHIHQNLIC